MSSFVLPGGCGRRSAAAEEGTHRSGGSYPAFLHIRISEKEDLCPRKLSNCPIILPIPACCGSCCPASAPCCSPPSTASWTACAFPTLWAKRLLQRSTSSCRCRSCWALSALCWAPAAVPSLASRWARATRKRPTAIFPCLCGQRSSRSVCWPYWASCSCARLPCCWAQRESCWTTPCATGAS